MKALQAVNHRYVFKSTDPFEIRFYLDKFYGSTFKM